MVWKHNMLGERNVQLIIPVTPKAGLLDRLSLMPFNLKYKDLSILVRLEENSQKSTKVTQVKVDEY